jgi:hypothetical protein
MPPGRLKASSDIRPTARPLLWVSPDALDCQDRHRASAFRQVGLGCDDFNDLTSQFTVEFWRTDYTRGANRHYLGRSDASGPNWSFSIATGDTNDASNDATKAIKVYLSQDGTTTKTRIANQALPNKEWSHCVVVYQGGQPTDDTKLKIYLDGQLVPHTGSAGLPPFLNESTIGLRIGYMPGLEPASYFDGAMNRVRIWWAPLVQSQITQLWNGGLGLYYFELGTLLDNMFACYDVPHDSSDLTGNGHDIYNLSDSFPVPAWVTTRILDQSPERLVFTSSFGQGFHWEAEALNARAAWVSYGYSQMIAPAQRWAECPAGEVIQAVMQYTPGIINYEYNLVGTSDVERTDRNFRCQFNRDNVGQMKAALRVQSGTAIDASVLSPSNLPYYSPLLVHWRGLGQGNSQSLRFSLNGVVGTVTPGTAANQWLASVPGRDIVALGGIVAGGNPVANFGRVMHGELMVLPLVPDSQSSQLSQLLLRKYS